MDRRLLRHEKCRLLRSTEHEHERARESDGEKTCAERGNTDKSGAVKANCAL